MKINKKRLLIGIILGVILLFPGCNITAEDPGKENGEVGDNGDPDEENGEVGGIGDSDEIDNEEPEEPEVPQEPKNFAEAIGIRDISQTMYAKVDTSYRDDATYEGEILGNLRKFNEVKATGLVANGWVRIETIREEEAVEAFIYQGFLAEEEVQTVMWGSGVMEEEMVVISKPEDIQVLTNKQLSLPPDYEPEDLVQPEVAWGPISNYRYLRQEAAEALENLFNEALEEGISLYGRTGYRSYQAQEEIFINFVNNHGYQEARTFSAKPGQSEHQTGLAMDITAESVDYRLSGDFGETEEGQWVGENAHKHGFIIRYPKEKEEITGYIYEPWHLRYVGVDLATELYESGLTMEEYFGM